MSLPDVGDHFGRYRIDALLGAGGMGAVYLATDPRLGRQVALKVMAGVAVGGDADEAGHWTRRFEREAALLARLDSPHVIAVHDYGEQDGRPFLVTQYVPGGDLGALLRRRGSLTSHLAADICAQIAEALQAAHEVGVVHRDVKPANVLLRDPDAEQPDALLCDFGVARSHTDELTVPGSVTGTWAYLAPECARGEAASVASDIYALGCVLWTVVTGAPPYRGTDVEIALAHQQQPVPQLATTQPVGRGLNRIFATALAKEPARRYRDATALRRALTDLTRLPEDGTETEIGDDPSAAPPVGETVSRGDARSSPTRIGRRARWSILAAALVLLGTGSAVAIARPWQDYGADPGPSGPIQGDLDGDGRGDVAANISTLIGDQQKFRPAFTTWTGDSETFTTDGTAGPSDLPNRQWHHTDLDGDGRKEHTTWTVDGDAFRITGEGIDERVDRPAGFGNDRFPTSTLDFTDLDADGDSDLVAFAYHARDDRFWLVSRLREPDGWGPERSTVPVQLTDDEFYVYSAPGDLDGDGRGDLVVTTQDINADGEPLRVHVFSHTEDGLTRDSEWTYRPATTVLGLTTGDLDGDGRDEIVLGPGTDPKQVEVLDPDEAGEGKPPRQDHGDLFDGGDDDVDGSDLTVSDVDGDGDGDLVGAYFRDRRLDFFIRRAEDGELAPAVPAGTAQLPAGTISFGFDEPG